MQDSWPDMVTYFLIQTYLRARTCRSRWTFDAVPRLSADRRRTEIMFQLLTMASRQLNIWDTEV